MPLNPMEHTSKRYDAELETVRSRVLQMGGLVETQITAAIEALTTGNIQLAEQTIANALVVGVGADADNTHGQGLGHVEPQDLFGGQPVGGDGHGYLRAARCAPRF